MTDKDEATKLMRLFRDDAAALEEGVAILMDRGCHDAVSVLRDRAAELRRWADVIERLFETVADSP